MAEIIEDEILWTDSAKLSFKKIVEYLKENWTERETEKFVKRVAEVLSALKNYPEMFRHSGKRKNVCILCSTNIHKWRIIISRKEADRSISILEHETRPCKVQILFSIMLERPVVLALKELNIIQE